MGKQSFIARGELLRSGLNRELKKRMIKVLIWSVVLYGSETWTLRKEDIEVLEAFELWIWRRMEKISWTENITNEGVLKREEESRALLETMRNRQYQWIFHILRGNSILTTVLEGQMKGRKTRGRPRVMLLSWTATTATTTGGSRKEHRTELNGEATKGPAPSRELKEDHSIIKRA